MKTQLSGEYPTWAAMLEAMVANPGGLTTVQQLAVAGRMSDESISCILGRRGKKNLRVPCTDLLENWLSYHSLLPRVVKDMIAAKRDERTEYRSVLRTAADAGETDLNGDGKTGPDDCLAHFIKTNCEAAQLLAQGSAALNDPEWTEEKHAKADAGLLDLIRRAETARRALAELRHGERTGSRFKIG